MTNKASRALKAALAIGVVAVLSLSLVAMSACSTNEPAGHATKNVSAVPDATVSPIDCSGTLDAVAYMNYTLAQQSSWHSTKVSGSVSSFSNVTTTTYKDYKDGILVAEELVYTDSPLAKSNIAANQFLFIASPEEDRCVYKRTGSDPESLDAEPKDITWSDEAECWSEAYYNEHYGLFMDEISLYVLNAETAFDYEDSGEVDEEGNPIMVETRNGCGDVTYDETTGYYSQTFTLDTENSIYYYQYSMMTHGGLGSAPSFESVKVTFTFNSDWEIIEILEEDVEQVPSGLGFNVSNSSTTTTKFEYGASAVDTETFETGYAFFEPLIGTLEMVDIEVVETEGDENADLSSQDVEYTQYEKNLTLTVVMAVVAGVVIVLGIILTGVGCNTGKKKKDEGEEENGKYKG